MFLLMILFVSYISSVWRVDGANYFFGFPHSSTYPKSISVVMSPKHMMNVSVSLFSIDSEKRKAQANGMNVNGYIIHFHQKTGSLRLGLLISDELVLISSLSSISSGGGVSMISNIMSAASANVFNVLLFFPFMVFDFFMLYIRMVFYSYRFNTNADIITPIICFIVEWFSFLSFVFLLS